MSFMSARSFSFFSLSPLLPPLSFSLSHTPSLSASLLIFPLTQSADFGVNDPSAGNCTDKRTLEYTNKDQLDSREKTHFCDPAWTRGSAKDVDCAALDPFLCYKMNSFRFILAHRA